MVSKWGPAGALHGSIACLLPSGPLEIVPGELEMRIDLERPVVEPSPTSQEQKRGCAYHTPPSAIARRGYEFGVSFAANRSGAEKFAAISVSFVPMDASFTPITLGGSSFRRGPEKETALVDAGVIQEIAVKQPRHQCFLCLRESGRLTQNQCCTRLAIRRASLVTSRQTCWPVCARKPDDRSGARRD